MIERVRLKPTTGEALSGLESLIAAARDRLSQNPDYIALSELEKAHAEILRRSRVASSPLVARAPEPPFNLARESEDDRPLGQLQAAIKALKEAGHPLTIFELIDRVRALGAVVGGEKPAVNLGSTLSRSDEISSIRWRGQPAWWFTGQGKPPE
jgi:hypothetical protein